VAFRRGSGLLPGPPVRRGASHWVSVRSHETRGETRRTGTSTGTGGEELSRRATPRVERGREARTAIDSHRARSGAVTYGTVSAEAPPSRLAGSHELRDRQLEGPSPLDDELRLAKAEREAPHRPARATDGDDIRLAEGLRAIDAVESTARRRQRSGAARADVGLDQILVGCEAEAPRHSTLARLVLGRRIPALDLGSVLGRPPALAEAADVRRWAAACTKPRPPVFPGDHGGGAVGTGALGLLAPSRARMAFRRCGPRHQHRIPVTASVRRPRGWGGMKIRSQSCPSYQSSQKCSFRRTSTPKR
jgi:hypothetical protein